MPTPVVSMDPLAPAYPVAALSSLQPRVRFAPGSSDLGALSSDGGDGACSHRAASLPRKSEAAQAGHLGGTNALTAPLMANKSHEAQKTRAIAQAAAWAALPDIVAMLRRPLLNKAKGAR